jgi:hypothetical protein
MMRKYCFSLKYALGVAGVLAALGVALPAAAETLHAKLTGYEEVPAVSSPGTGDFRAKIDKRRQTIDYELSYEGTQGSVFMAHIHFAQRGVNGGIVVWLCGQAPATPPANTPLCPTPDGTVRGLISADSTQFTGAAGQLLSAGEFDELAEALREGVTYVNVHTSAASGGVPSGELRGQIK